MSKHLANENISMFGAVARAFFYQCCCCLCDNYHCIRPRIRLNYSTKKNWPKFIKVKLNLNHLNRRHIFTDQRSNERISFRSLRITNDFFLNKFFSDIKCVLSASVKTILFLLTQRNDFWNETDSLQLNYVKNHVFFCFATVWIAITFIEFWWTELYCIHTNNAAIHRCAMEQ